MTDTPASVIASLTDTQASLELLGGKGASLARLVQAGIPVPPGFVVTTAAYTQYVAEPGLLAQIAEEISQAYAAFPGYSPAVAVRSSATTEDLAGASFAGQQETYLNICGREAVLESVQKCWASLWTPRSVAYRTRLGLPVDGTAMAVVVQLMVPADAAGVLFTANPVTGNPNQVVINAVWGLGEALVSGLVNPDTILIAKSSGFIIERVTAEKKLMTIPAGGGTQVQPVPPGMQQTPVLSDPQAAQLAKLGMDVENLYQTPVDIEWALNNGEFVLLQARPITALPDYFSEEDPFSWNDSLQGEALWSNVNFGEAMTEVMTPLTCSVVSQFTLKDWQYIPGYSTVGNIGGYLYLNISVFASLYRVLGRSRQDLLDEMEATLYMQLPETMQIPTFPLTRSQMLSSLLASAKVQYRQALGVRKTRAYIEANPGWFQDIVHRIQAAENEQELLACFQQHIQKHVLDGVWCVMGSATHSANYTLNLRRDLEKMVGAEDAGILIANVSGDDETLLSLEPVLGLSRIARGEMTKEHYLEEYGHRGPDEFELSKPRPAEDPHWLDRQLELYNHSPVDVIALIQKQRAAFIDAFSRLLSGFPRQSKSFQRRIEKSVQKARLREEARSAYVRDRWSLRLFALRAGEMSFLGQDIFYLTLDEILGLLGGDGSARRFIPSRKAAYSRFKTLSPFPSIILGPYDPFEKASEPAGWVGEMDGSKIIKGSPASAGQVEGVVRILTRPDEWREGQQGEILCAYQTDIAWTLIFPFFAGIITDVGAPLSHSAIVARELGIPAVVGCGNATRRLKTGDRVRLDGGRGIVEVIAD